MEGKKIKMTAVTLTVETRQRLFLLKPIVPKRRNQKSYEDVIHFLLNYYEEKEKNAKLSRRAS